MIRRLDTRTTTTSPRAADRISVSAKTARKAAAKGARTDHKSARTQPHPAPEGASMDYQMGFTSGPSV